MQARISSVHIIRRGSLTPGKEADIIILDATSINVAPLNNVPGAVVSLMDRTNVETVIVAGKVRKWKGKLLDVDLNHLRRQLEASRDHVFERGGRPAEPVPLTEATADKGRLRPPFPSGLDTATGGTPDPHRADRRGHGARRRAGVSPDRAARRPGRSRDRWDISRIFSRRGGGMRLASATSGGAR